MATLFVVTSFLAAALLFLVEPMVGRMVLPAFGGSPQVWTTTMVFFQVALLGGYAYAHAATTRISPRRQPWLHLGFALVPLVFLPVALDVAPSGAGGAAPIRELLTGLVVGVSAPFFLIATSGPLLQRWFSWTDHPSAHDPYFLYAAGNLGSAVGLVAYPFLVEPAFSVAAQSRVWAAGYLVVLGLLGACAVVVTRRRAAVVAAPEEDTAPRASISWTRTLTWVACGFIPSSLMLGATTRISTDIAAVPLIWVAPLGLYLLTFTVAFSRLGPKALHVAQRLAVPVAVLAIVVDTEVFGAVPAIVIQLLFVMVGGLVGHGMLAEDRPPPALLTRFYLIVGVGGALGGVFNGIIAPLVFDSLFEHGLAAAALVGLSARWRPILKARRGWDVANELAASMAVGVLPIGLLFARLTGLLPELPAFRWLIVTAAVAPLLTSYGRHAVVVLAVLIVALTGPIRRESRAAFTSRTFFGQYEVTIRNRVVRLTNGTTAHGTQDQRNAQIRLRPLAYYDPNGPLGWIMSRVQGDIGVIGLGAGAVAAYGQEGDTIVFHEIDPEVADIARTWFTYLDDSKAHIEVVIGDGRLTIDQVPGRYDILLVDGFTSDAVPVHLITVEAFQAYLDALRDDGLIAVHITNRYLDLAPVVKGAAEALGMEVVGAAGTSLDGIPSTWVALSRNHERIDYLRNSGWGDLVGRSVPWTDQRSSLFSVMHALNPPDER